MSIAVTTPTGNIGSRVAQRLLEAGADVTLLVRSASKVEDLVRAGAKVVEGTLEDSDFVARATEGAEALFWLTPPNMTVSSLRLWRRGLAANAREAVRRNGIGHVVHLSSIGAQLSWGTGPIASLHDGELLLNDVAPSIRHLRAGFFMENFLFQVEPIRAHGSLFQAMPGNLRVPMVATRDIGDVAARLLLDRGWSGQRAVGVHGPADVSGEEAAAVIGKALGRSVRYVQVTGEQARESLLKMGVSPDVANSFVEMYGAFSTNPSLVAEPRTAETTTPTTLAKWAAEVLKPAVGA
jgi:uncharacterized protein YbjT (DUF2867 family)